MGLVTRSGESIQFKIQHNPKVGSVKVNKSSKAKGISESDVWKLSSPCNVCHYSEDLSVNHFKRGAALTTFESKEEELKYLVQQNHLLKMHIAFLRKTVMDTHESKFPVPNPTTFTAKFTNA
jgi:hypothetical protein